MNEALKPVYVTISVDKARHILGINFDITCADGSKPMVYLKSKGYATKSEVASFDTPEESIVTAFGVTLNDFLSVKDDLNLEEVGLKGVINVARNTMQIKGASRKHMKFFNYYHLYMTFDEDMSGYNCEVVSVDKGSNAKACTLDEANLPDLCVCALKSLMHRLVTG